MDRWRAAGALLALAACFACSAAAPTASNQTALDLYEGAPEGCYYNFQHYGEGDRIMTNEPCLNCTCHNRMLMCYLRVCPFTKAIGQDCTVEKRADQCCPIVTCPDVPVDLLTSTSTTSPAEYGATGLGKLDKYGCSINGKYFPEGSKVPPTPNKPCEHCYCIRNMTTCVMQECTLHVDGCTPIYHKDVCCPVRYSCDHPEDEVPLLDDMSTTVRPTPGFLLTTTTISPVTQMTQDCVHDDQIFADGALIKTEKACEHCYCMKGDIVCVVQECGAPMENEGKNCTSLPPREGQCCPDTYICEGDELTSDLPTESTTEYIEKQTTLSPPRRAGVEGSGYRNEPDEVPYTEIPTLETEVEGSGDEQEILKPLGPDEIIPTSEDGGEYIYISTKAPSTDKHEQATTEVNEIISSDLGETTDEQFYISTIKPPVREEDHKLPTSGTKEEDNLEPQQHIPTTLAPESYEIPTTELGESLNTVPDIIPEEELLKPHEYVHSTTIAPTRKESESILPIEGEEVKTTPSEIAKPEYSTPSSSEEIVKVTSISADILGVTPKVTPEKEYTGVDSEVTKTTSPTIVQESEGLQQEKEKEMAKPEQFAPGTTSYPVEEGERLTTEPDHAQNTVAVAEEESTHPHILTTTIGLPSVEEERTTVANVEENIVTNKVITDEVLAPHEHVPTTSPIFEENKFITTEPDRGLNTIPSEIIEESSSELSLPSRTTVFVETQTTESSIITQEMQTQDVDIQQTPAPETATLAPESIVTKGDQYTITTEPSFRKEDESSISTEKPKEFEPTTVKSEFAEEGLIPTSEHDEKLGTSSDVPSTDEEFTTIVPEYIKEVEESIEVKQTTESILIASVVTEGLSDKVSEPTSEQEGELSSNTEKPTALVPEHVETHEEPSRIPGEGDCLLNGITYINNSVVPSTNNCHTGCRCASSIIKCDPIICSPPPDYMDNCQSVYDSPDSCCPTYVCDHPRETVAPQSDNQVSGTESPMPSPTIECRGDQCEITESAKIPSVPPQLCTSGDCLIEDDHKPETECGPDGCVAVLQKPDKTLPSVGQAGDCTDGKCQLPQTQGEISHTKPCEGEQCQKEEGFISLPSPQLCQNEEECKTLEIPVVQATPCEGESCDKIDCGNGNCDSNVISPPQQVSVSVHECTGDEPCRRKETDSVEKSPTACEGSNCKDETKTQDGVDLNTELPISEQTPAEQFPQKEVVTEVEIATHLPEGQISTLAMKDTQDYSTEPYTGTMITEADIQKEKPAIEDETTKKPTELEEEDTKEQTVIDQEEKEKPTVEDESTEKPTVLESAKTEIPAIIEEETDKPANIDEENKVKPALVSDKGEERPLDVEKESTPEPIIIEKDSTELPSFVGEDGTEIPIEIDEEAKYKPIVGEEGTKEPAFEEEGTKKPAFTELEISSIPTIAEDETTDKPTITEDKGTEEPTILEKDGTAIPAVVEEASEKPSLMDDKHKVEKPLVFEKEGTEEPNLVEEGTEKVPVVSEEGKDKPEIIDEKDNEDEEKLDKDIVTEKSVLIETEGTDKPIIIEEDGKEKPAVFEREGTNKPDIVEGDGEEKPAVTEMETTETPYVIKEEGTIKPTVTDVKEKPTGGEEQSTEISHTHTVEEGTYKPVIEDEDSKEKPTVTEEGEKDTLEVNMEGTQTPVLEEDDRKQTTITELEITEKPTIADKPTGIDELESTEKPSIDEEKSSVSPAMTIAEGTEEPAIIEETDTEKPVMVGEDGKKKVGEETTKKPTVIDREGTELPEDYTEKPIRSDEGKERPDVIDEELSTKKPVLTEGENAFEPAVTEKVGTDEPVIVDKEGTEEPAFIEEENTEKPALIEREGTELPTAVEEEATKKPSINIEKDQEKPVVEEDIKKPITNEDTGELKPEVPEEESTPQPAITEKESTQEPVIFDKEGTEVPYLIDEGKIKPSIDEEDMRTTAPFEEESTETTVVVKEEGKEKPMIIDEEIEEKPTETEGKVTEGPQSHEEEGSGTEIPEEHDTEVKLPDIVVEPTASPVTDSDKITKVPIYGSQTTYIDDVEHAVSTELNAVESISENTTPKVILPSEAPEIKVTESKESESEEPVSLDHSRTPDITTESLTEPESSTKIPEIEKDAVYAVTEQNVELTSPKLDTNVNKVEGAIVGQDMTSAEAVSTQTPQLQEITESVEKGSEMGSISEHEVFTDTSELEAGTTMAPGVDSLITETQASMKPAKPELAVTDKIEEESSTKVYEEEKIKPVPESHVTEVTTSSPEKYGTSAQVPEAPEIVNADTPKPELPELSGSEPDKHTTQLPAEVFEEEIKTDLPEIYKPDKEETITESSEYSVTEPVRRFTEIEDSFVTALEDKTTEYHKEPTEHHVPSATEKIDESVNISPTTPEEPQVADMETTKLPEETPSSDKLVPVFQEHSTQTPGSEKEKPDIIESPVTDISVPEITESHEVPYIPEKHVTETSYEEKATSIPDLSDQINIGTTSSEGHATVQEVSTGIPQHHIAASEEYPKATESYIIVQHETEDYETSTKLGEQEITDTQSITTEVPKTSIKEEEVQTKAPEIIYTDSHALEENAPSVTETQKLSTDSSISLEDGQTETPGTRLTSEIPQSLVTVYHETLGEETSVSSMPEEEPSIKPELQTTQSQDITKAPELHVTGLEEVQTVAPVVFTEAVEVSTKEGEPEVIEQYDKITKAPEESVTEKLDTATTLRETPAVSQEVITAEPETDKILLDVTTAKQTEEVVKSTEHTAVQTELSETTPYLIELEEHTHKILEELTTLSPFEEDHSDKVVEDISTPSSSPSAEEYTHKIEEHLSTEPPFDEKRTTEHAEVEQEPQTSDSTTKISDDSVETATKKAEATKQTDRPSEVTLAVDVSHKITESIPIEDTTPAMALNLDDKYNADDKDYTTSTLIHISEESTPATVTDSDKLPVSESEIAVPIEKETSSTEKPLHPIVSHETTLPEDEFIFSTTKATTVRQEDTLPPVSDDKYSKPEEKPIDSSEVLASSTTEVPKPSVSDVQSTDEIPAPEEEGHFPPSGTSGYGEPDYVEEDQAFGPGTCRYGGKVYVSAQQIPRDDPCDFCFCFRSDIICLQQSCPPPIHGCHEEPIQGFCCPRYECPVSMATTVNVTTTTTTTTTTLPPHFPTHSYKGAAQRRGCQIKGHTYKVGEVVRSSSGPCLHCTCGGDGQMKCDPKACTPEPMLRQMIAAAVSAKRRR